MSSSTQYLPKQIGEFAVEEDGTLSLEGLTVFPFYSAEGGSPKTHVKYRIVCEEVAKHG